MSRRSFRLQAIADGTGDAEVTLTVPQGSNYYVERLVIRDKGAAVSNVRIYDGAEATENLIDGSDSGNFDVADMASPIFLNAGSILRIIWHGATPGANCSVRGQYAVESLGRKRRRQRIPYTPEQLAYGTDIPFNGHKVTAGFGGDGF